MADNLATSLRSMHQIDLSKDPERSAGSASAAASSPWAPFRFARFRQLWFATLTGFLGNWMQQVGAATLMTTLTPSPMMVALVQTAASLPAVFLGLLAGALADLIDRRRWLIFTQIWITLSAILCCVVIGRGTITPTVLLALTALLGAGFALQSPAVQASIGESVPGDSVPAALSLGGVSFNLSRIVGPALAGGIAGVAGGLGVYATVAVSGVAVMAVFLRQPRSAPRPARPPERLWTALHTGVRFMRHDPACLSALIHTLAFIGCGSATWALLPALARSVYHMGPGGYGLLLGSLGAGGIAGAIVYPAVRTRFAPHTIVAGAALGFAAVNVALAAQLPFGILVASLLFGGMAWSFAATTIYASLQMSLPDWVRARGISIYGVTYFVGMAGGAALWGGLATWSGTQTSLNVAAGALAIAAAYLRRQPLAMPARKQESIVDFDNLGSQTWK